MSKVSSPSSLERVASLPIVQDSISKTRSIIESTNLSNALYLRSEAIVLSVYHFTEPKVHSLPLFDATLARADHIAHGALDIVIRTFPIVEKPTEEVLHHLMSPIKAVDERLALPVMNIVDDVVHRILPIKERSTITEERSGYAKAVGLTTEFRDLAFSSGGDVASMITKTSDAVREMQSQIGSRADTTVEQFHSASAPVLKALEQLVSRTRAQVSQLPANTQEGARLASDELNAFYEEMKGISQSSRDVPSKVHDMGVLTKNKMEALFEKVKSTAFDAVRDVKDAVNETASDATQAAKPKRQQK